MLCRDVFLFMLDSFEDAKNYRDKFRAQKPAVYNPARLNQIHCVSVNVDTSMIVHTAEQEFIDDNPNNAEQSFEHEFNDDSTNNSIENEEPYDYNESQPVVNSADNEVKDPLTNVVLETHEVTAFENIFNENNDDAISIESGELDVPQQPHTENVVISPGGTRKVTTIIGEDCEMTYELDKAVFQPAPVGFQVKLNDKLSGNIPFKENVSHWPYLYIVFIFHF